jgi:hypothetical protein
MTTLTHEQSTYLDQLMLEPPGQWPHSLQITATRACQEVQASYAVIRAIAAAWILDGRERILSIGEIAALQPEVDLRPSMS